MKTKEELCRRDSFFISQKESLLYQVSMIKLLELLDFRAMNKFDF